MTENKKSPSLKEVQRTLGLAITRGESIKSALALIDTRLSHLTHIERFEVYSDAWFLRLEESLSDDFAGVKKRLGDGAWEPMLRAYLQTFPSRSFTIARAADKLPQYLKQNQAPAWLVELAALELDICRAQTSLNSIAFDVRELQTLSEDEAEKLCLALQPSTYLHSFSFNAPEILENDADPREFQNQLIVFRENWLARTEELGFEEFQFLSSLISGLSLGEIADQQGEADWLPWLVKWSQRGVIGPVQTSPTKR